MKKNKISFVIPVYNTVNYLDICFNSILKQNYDNWELIIIDDGSFDGSGEKCDQYAKNDSRIRVIHTDNNGVAAARNEGIKHISGDYVLFMDSDDYIEDEAFEYVIPILNKKDYDIVFFDFKKVTEEGHNLGQSTNMVGESILSKDEAFKNLLNYGGTLWNKLIKYEIIKKNNIKFEQSLKASEDWLFLVEAMGHSSTFYYIDKKIYNYVIRNNSLSRNDNIEKLLAYNENVIKGLEECIYYLENIDNRYVDIIEKQIVWHDFCNRNKKLKIIEIRNLKLFKR